MCKRIGSGKKRTQRTPTAIELFVSEWDLDPHITAEGEYRDTPAAVLEEALKQAR
jgi:hypothetical protein